MGTSSLTGSGQVKAARSSADTSILTALDHTGVIVLVRRVYSVMRPSFHHLPSKNRSGSFLRRPAISGGVTQCMIAFLAPATSPAFQSFTQPAVSISPVFQWKDSAAANWALVSRCPSKARWTPAA
jgi:hypothetical protein